MDSLPKLDTSTKESTNNSARNSFASAIEYDSNSARNSYSSVSERSSLSSRTSYSSIPEFGRVSSFSRTADTFLPETTENTPISSRGSSPDSPTRWGSQKEKMTSNEASKTELSESVKAEEEEAPRDGFTALKELTNVRNVMCVAFGAFDRYYISWEDNEGVFHQESRKLPKCLNKWLYPADGSTRHLPSLQVSFGSNDEFFASDENGKLSSRDQCCQDAEKKPTPRLAEITRGMMRKKAHTISSPTIPENKLTLSTEPEPVSPKLERRKTLQLSQQNQAIMPLGDRPQLTRWDSKADGSRAEKRRSIFGGIPVRTPSMDSTASATPVEEPTTSTASVPNGVPESKLPENPQQAAAKDESKRGYFWQRAMRAQSIELKPETLPGEQRTNIFMNKPLRQVPVEVKPEPPKEEVKWTPFGGILRKTAVTSLPEPQEAQPPEDITLQPRDITPPATEVLPPRGNPFSKTVLPQKASIVPALALAPTEPKSPEPQGLDIQLERQRAEQRRSLLNSVPPVRPSWPERRTLIMNKDRIQTLQQFTPVRSGYVDAAVQTEIIEEKICNTLEIIQIPPPHAVPIGSMLDFFRGQSRLGDALRYV